MVLTSLVALKVVDDLQLAQLSTAALAQTVGIDPNARNAETLSLFLFLGLREDTVLAHAMTMVAANPDATSALVATAAAWRVLAKPTTFPARLERHGDFGILVSTDGKVRVAVCIPAGLGNHIVRVSFASPSTFHTSVIVSSHHLVTDDVCSDDEILFGGNLLLNVFEVLATVPNCVDRLRRLLTRAIALYEGLVYDIVRPPLATSSRVAGSVLVPFEAMLGGTLSLPMELIVASPPRKTPHDALVLDMSSHEGDSAKRTKRANTLTLASRSSKRNATISCGSSRPRMPRCHRPLWRRAIASTRTADPRCRRR
ncbi:hypothetical protein SDRG_17153 [Saprolegnia diclina VS20]|uniref:Uncharacterized protein n=1 Tax=Saprolegnia diclina (strain VS20) TaxID=1156394 RepID=T0PI01_SAPDV|nr:hypothetical protein SDRG_17153 [Saprolegnia diclina VS20]EQC24964.1 hypothetical protein SDRG_17153 [Saprolegnia diclina VS20]|eukprot:XP_008621612.1 hypothetical protein SDRG_17153 [Saprolegnia diclina VS20]